MERYKNEICWVTGYNADHSIDYMITSNQARDVYYLYTPTPDGGWQRWGKDANPKKLTERYKARR